MDTMTRAVIETTESARLSLSTGGRVSRAVLPSAPRRISRERGLVVCMTDRDRSRSRPQTTSRLSINITEALSEVSVRTWFQRVHVGRYTFHAFDASSEPGSN
ncbi:MAG: hypothetical protein BMS9Abin12_1710 [Acidimicrobiia bacterium]|nr:MAG: hypothetical protein BMS9Abin12_1710 [Acidimicrobiia bacterium]